MRYGVLFGVVAVAATVFGSVAPNPELVSKALKGEVPEARADWWGFDEKDSTKQLQAALDSGVRRLVLPKMTGPWYASPLRGRSDLELVFEDGAELRAKRGAFKGVAESLLTFRNCENVTIRGRGVLRMWKADYQRAPYKPAEWRHALSILACRNVLVDGLRICESGGDGIYVSTSKPANGFRSYSEGVTIRNVKCLHNHRQGVSVIACKDLLIERCVFSDTHGTSPQAGIDFEPNSPEDAMINCVVRECLFERNGGFGVDGLFTYHDEATPKLDITISRCYSRDNERAYHFNGIAQNGLFHSNVGRIVVTNCVAREVGEAEKPYSAVISWGRTVTDAGGRTLAPVRADDWNPDAIEVTDRRPGELAPLSRTRFRMKAEYLFYAAQAGTVRLRAQQLPVGTAGKPSTNALAVATFAGDVVTTLAAPSVKGTDFTIAVPAKGVYRLSWTCGWGTSLVLLACDAPIGFSMFSDKKAGGRWMSPFLYGVGDACTAFFAVPKGAGAFAAVASGWGGGLGQSAHAVVADPDGRVVYDRDNVTFDDVFVSDSTPKAGLWTITAKRPSNNHWNNFCFDLAGGVPPIFFLSPDKYWTSK